MKHTCITKTIWAEPIGYCNNHSTQCSVSATDVTVYVARDHLLIQLTVEVKYVESKRSLHGTNTAQTAVQHFNDWLHEHSWTWQDAQLLLVDKSIHCWVISHHIHLTLIRNTADSRGWNQVWQSRKNMLTMTNSLPTIMKQGNLSWNLLHENITTSYYNVLYLCLALNNISFLFKLLTTG